MSESLAGHSAAAQQKAGFPTSRENTGMCTRYIEHSTMFASHEKPVFLPSRSLSSQLATAMDRRRAVRLSLLFSEDVFQLHEYFMRTGMLGENMIEQSI